MTTVARLLREAADLIEASPKLAKGSFAIPLHRITDDGHCAEIENGFDIGAYPGEPICYCTGGALNVTISKETERRLTQGFTNTGNVWSAVYIALARQLGVQNPAMFIDSYVYKWNDAPERTKDEVVATLRAAADEDERINA